MPTGADDILAEGSPPPPAVRASTRDREATVHVLYAAAGDGCLDLDEVDERVAAAYAARYRGELDPLLADLPTGPPATAGTTDGWAALWGAAVGQGRRAWLGPDVAPSGPPTSRQSVAAAVLLAAAFLWLVLCAILGFVVGVAG